MKQAPIDREERADFERAGTRLTLVEPLTPSLTGTGPSIGHDCPVPPEPTDLNPWHTTKFLAVSLKGGRVDEAAVLRRTRWARPGRIAQPVRFSSTMQA